MNQETRKALIKEAIKEFRQEEKKAKKNRVYHNTELLMKNYSELKQHAENAVYDLRREVFCPEDDPDLDSIGEMNTSYDGIYINSIMRSKARTAIMVHHIDVALEALRCNAVRGGYEDKYNLFMEIYEGKQTYEDLAEKYHCTSMTVRRWKNEVLFKLSILLFGEEALILGA